MIGIPICIYTTELLNPGGDAEFIKVLFKNIKYHYYGVFIILRL